MPTPISAIGITSHFLIRLRERYGIPRSRLEVVRSLTTASTVYEMASGSVIGLEFPDGYAFGIMRNMVLVTAVSVEQACSNCPQGVFGYLLLRGKLQEALNIRTRYHTHRLPMPLGGIPWCPPLYLSVWDRFKAVRAPEILC